MSAASRSPASAPAAAPSAAPPPLPAGSLSGVAGGMGEAKKTGKRRPPNTEEILVSSTDTLERLAVMSDVSVAELMRLNGMFSRTLVPGQTLFVPQRCLERMRSSSLKEAGHSIREAVGQDQAGYSPPRASLDAPLFSPVKLDALIKLPARFVLPAGGSESVGNITVTRSHFYFEPALHDMTAVELGLAVTSVNVPLLHINTCDSTDIDEDASEPAPGDPSLASVVRRRVARLVVYATLPGRGSVQYTFLVENPKEAARLCQQIREWVFQRVTEEEAQRVPLELQLPRLVNAEVAFTPKQCIAQLRRALPGTLQQADWTLVYSTLRDGISLNSFYRLVEGRAPSLLVVQDEQQRIFGGLAPESWQRRSDRYYGVGNSFLFTFSPTFRVFSWTGDNDCVQLSDDRSIGMGGGGAFGLWLDAGFVHGTSRRSPTYDNDPLPGVEEFRVWRLELYAFE